jgi:hypothetical protein
MRQDPISSCSAGGTGPLIFSRRPLPGGAARGASREQRIIWREPRVHARHRQCRRAGRLPLRVRHRRDQRRRARPQRDVHGRRFGVRGRARDLRGLPESLGRAVRRPRAHRRRDRRLRRRAPHQQDRAQEVDGPRGGDVPRLRDRLGTPRHHLRLHLLAPAGRHGLRRRLGDRPGLHRRGLARAPPGPARVHAAARDRHRHLRRAHEQPAHRPRTRAARPKPGWAGSPPGSGCSGSRPSPPRST